MPKATHSIRAPKALEIPDVPPAIEPAPRPEIDEQAIAVRAYELWQDRGAPIGSPEIDWFRAQDELNSEQSLVTHG